MDKQQAYYSLWNNFGLPAYDELSVPDNAVLPYITYQVITGDIEQQLFPTASLYYRSSSWATIDAKLAEISAYVEDMDPIPLNDGGYMYVRKGSPWAQRMADETDKDIRRYVLNLAVEFLTRT